VASVSVDDVRDVINVSSTEVPDAKVLKMIKRAEVTLELETECSTQKQKSGMGRTIDKAVFEEVKTIYALKAENAEAENRVAPSVSRVLEMLLRKGSSPSEREKIGRVVTCSSPFRG